jgi:nucleoside-diphosphate-sugar epimerase
VDIDKEHRLRALMIGGTGFLGFFTCRDLASAGHEAIAVGLEAPAPGTMPEGVRSVVCNVDTCADEELNALLAGVDCVIHAAGADGRFSAKAPVIDAYRARNVAPMTRLITAMKRAGSRNLIIFGSYYTALARSRAQLIDLSRNPYPLSRQEQMDLSFAHAGGDLAVNVLELPYIFGGAPGRGTLWGYVMDKVRAPGVVQCPGGVTACVTASQVAKAALGALAWTKGHAAWPIGGENLDYRTIYSHFAAALGVAPTIAPSEPAAEMAAAEAQRKRLADDGVETGYDPLDVARWQEADLSLDPAPAMAALGYGPEDIATSIRETVAATLAHGGQGPASLRKTT